MQTFLWLAVLIATVLGMDWGANQIAAPLRLLRQQWGITQAAGAAFVALATASPEALINTISAVRGSEDIGLGNMLGSNIISVPGIITVAYIASMTSSSKGKDKDETNQSNNKPSPSSNQDKDNQSNSMPNSSGNDENHRNQLTGKKQKRNHLLRLEPQAFSTQAVPYMLIVMLAAVLTIPKPWRGLQPIDGWIMVAAYITFVVNAIFQGRTKGEEVEWEKKGIALAVGGVLALATSAFLAVTATENLAIKLKISEAIAGLFITSTMSVLPELFATWQLAKDGQESTAATAVCADNTLTITLGLFPLALIWLPVKPEEFKLFYVNMAAVILFAAMAATLMYQGDEKYSFSLRDVMILCGTYVVYVAVIVFGVLKVFS